MGQIVAAAVAGHVPTVMLPEPVRRRIGGGEDTSLVGGFARMRDELEAAGTDTVVIFDTHWFTTTEHVLNARAQHKGVFTSEELPHVITDHEYDYPGAPGLAREVADLARERAIPVIATENEHVPQHYPTLNVLHYVHRGPERVLPVGTCQTATADDYLEFGEVIGQAIRRTSSRAALIGSGGMSHRFWPLKELRAHNAYDPANVITPEARAMDEKILSLWSEGDHAAVIDLYPEYRKFSPEGYFGHYLMLAGALGGRRWTAKGRMLSNYENAVGTGQVHVIFDLDGSDDGSSGMDP